MTRFAFAAPLLALGAVAALAAPAKALVKGSTAQVLTCAAPIKSGESAAAIKARFGKDARVMKVDGPEGMEFPALVVWPNDPTRRIEVLFDDDDKAMRKASSVRIVAEGSKWRMAGVGVGSTLAEVVKANGGDVTVSGFGWDYGGSVDTRKGRLDRLPGGCALGLKMDVGPELANPPEGVFGDGVTLKSEDALIKAARPRVVEMTYYWPK